jgi:hypothetical protein
VSQVDKIEIGTRRRLLSADFNNAERLSSRALLESISALGLADVYKVAAAGVGGVVGGLTVRAVVGTNEVEVQPGIALVAQTPASATYDAPVEWIELGAATRVDLGGLVDGGSPRLVTIEIEATQVAKVNAPVDVFDPVTGTFGVANQDVVTGSSPTLTATAGAAAASPVVAAGTPGRIPLAVVKLSTAQVSFSDTWVAVLMCRPLLEALGDKLAPRRYVRGGGVSVGEENGGVLVNLNTTTVHDINLSMLGIDSRISGATVFANSRTPNTTDPATLAGAVQPVYGYAVPPPWASDYGNIAPREAWQQNPNQLSLAGTPESVVGGDGSSFSSLAPVTSTVAHRSAIVIWDSSTPTGLDQGPLGNASARVTDARGPHPDTALGGAGSITLDATQDVSWGVSQIVTESVYIGSIASLGAGLFLGQAYKGRGYVRVIDTVDVIAGTGNRPIFVTSASTAGLVVFYPGRWPNMAVGDAEIIPASAITVDLFSRFDVVSPGPHVLKIASAFGFGATSLALALGSYEVLELGDATFGVEHLLVTRNVAQTAQHLVTKGAGALASAIGLTGYEDMLLAAR